MNCREVVESLIDYLDGELPEAQRVEFEHHLEVCQPCGAYLETYKETIRLERAVREAPDQPVSADVPEDLIRAILAARRKSAS